MPTIEAKITDVRRQREGSPFITIRTDPALNPPLATKYPEGAREALDLMQSGDLVVIEYDESERTDDSGKVWINRYYKKAHGKPQISLDDLPVEPEATQTQRPSDPRTAWRISLAAGAKLAVGQLQYRHPEDQTPEAVWLAAQLWGLRLYTTTIEDAEQNLGIGGSQDGRAEYGDPEFPEDDIPF